MKYAIGGRVTVCVYTIVEANSYMEALRESERRPLVKLVFRCAGGDADKEWVTDGELDGSEYPTGTIRR